MGEFLGLARASIVDDVNPRTLGAGICGVGKRSKTTGRTPTPPWCNVHSEKRVLPWEDVVVQGTRLTREAPISKPRNPPEVDKDMRLPGRQERWYPLNAVGQALTEHMRRFSLRGLILLLALGAIGLASPALTPARAAAPSSALIWPFEGPITSYFGEPRGEGSFHQGIDIDGFGRYGEPVVAAASGTVVEASWHQYGLGLHVVIQHDDGSETVYAHLSETYVEIGQMVGQGEPVGAIGCTGYCTGDHLHFELHIGGVAVDPLPYLLSSVPTCGGLAPTIVGSEGDDVISGTTGPDVIHGLGGNDTIRGRGGDDVICGGAGKDTLKGGVGNDKLFGQAGRDTLEGWDGRDTLKGGTGSDELLGQRGNDTLRGGRGDDVLKGGKGNDKLNGGAASDSCQGGPGTDTAVKCETASGVP